MATGISISGIQLAFALQTDPHPAVTLEINPAELFHSEGDPL
jgi:hypothetical protein